MTEQKPFDFDPSKHHRRDGQRTSEAAAHAMRVTAMTLMRKIYAALYTLGTGTQTEVAAYLKMPPGVVWKRLSDLKNQGMIEASGVTRKGPSGRQQIAWRVRHGPRVEFGEPIGHTMERKG